MTPMTATTQSTAPPPAAASATHVLELEDDVIRARAWVEELCTHALTGVVDVLVDGSGRLGALSYLVPAELELRPGDAVEVPFGTRQAFGMVLGPGDPAVATREITRNFGKRADATEIACAHLIAQRHFVELPQVASRLAPTSGKGAEPVTDWEVALDEGLEQVPTPELGDPGPGVLRRFAARPLECDPARFAAKIAAELASDGQVLVVCPTVELVEQTLAAFASGARRIDRKADRGAWRGFSEGSVRVGVGTRTAALFSAAKLAAIVVVEQDRAGHIEQRMPNTHARDVALLRSLVCDVPVVFTGAVPTPPALTAGVRLVAVQTGTEPSFVVADRTGTEGAARLLPRELTRALRDSLAAGHEPVVLVERNRSIHRCVRCETRREHAECESASSCSHAFDRCRCGETEVRTVGWDAPRLTRLLGNRARAVTLHELATVRDAGTVIVFDLDAVLRRPDLSADTRAAQVLATAATASGPCGVVVVATESPDSPVVRSFQAGSARALAGHLWNQHRARRLPPFGRLVTVEVERKRPPSTAGWPGQVLGPGLGPNGYELLVRIGADELPRLAPHIERLRRAGRCRVTVT
jgi:primosomal protein N'